MHDMKALPRLVGAAFADRLRVLVLRLKATELHMELRKLIEARIRRDSAQTKKR